MNPRTACGIALVLMGSLAAVETAEACAQWSAEGIYKIEQSNGFTVSFTLYQEGGHLHGRARYPGAVGVLRGDIIGERFALSVDWSASSRGEYVGAVDANGWIVGGKTYDSKNPGNAATWSAYAPLHCAVP